MRLVGVQVESLFDEALPLAVRELPSDLARLDELLSDPVLLAPIAAGWEAEACGAWAADDRDGAVRAADGD